MIDTEALGLIDKNIRDYYSETYNRLPSEEEYQTAFINAWTDLLFFGQAEIPRREPQYKFSTEDYLELL